MSDAKLSVDVIETFGQVTIEMPPGEWVTTLRTGRDDLGLLFFDWLSAVDERPDGFRIVCHLYNPESHVELLFRTSLDNDHPHVESATRVFRGAAWHERETAEMFGIDFDGHRSLTPLLLPEGFEGHPLRKDFVLAARAAKAWPGAKEPGESDSEAAPSRRKTLPPGVPDPQAWGPRSLEGETGS